MTRVVLDAGALIALERSDRAMWAVLKLAVRETAPVWVPSTALAQVWRGGARQAVLGRALAHCAIASFDARARAVGELCGRARTTDLADAHVALVTREVGDVVYTSDPLDLRRLLRVLGSSAVVVEC